MMAITVWSVWNVKARADPWSRNRWTGWGQRLKSWIFPRRSKFQTRYYNKWLKLSPRGGRSSFFALSSKLLFPPLSLLWCLKSVRGHLSGEGWLLQFRLHPFWPYYGSSSTPVTKRRFQSFQWISFGLFYPPWFSLSSCRSLSQNLDWTSTCQCSCQPS